MNYTEPSPIAIRTEGLSRSFGALQAVADLSLEVPRGIVFGLLGRNGAGKTTTIRLLLGLLEPTAGRADVLGLDVRARAALVRARSGALLEHSGLYERLSAEENLEFQGRVAHMPRPERQARARELLAHFGLWERRAEPVGGWSRGMRQKLAVARALFHRPELVFLDEPTAGLDPVATVALREDLASLVAGEGVTVFLNTHHLAEAEKLCHQVAIMRDGRLVALGRPDQLGPRRAAPALTVVGRGFGPPALEALAARPEVLGVERANGHLRITLAERAEAAPLVGLLVGEGAQIEEVRREAASLEATFLELMAEEVGDAA